VNTRLEDAIESVLVGVLPGDNQTAFGVETLGLAVAGLPPLQWAALRFRCLGDQTAARELWPALVGIAVCSPHQSVRKRAGLLASLTLAEESTPSVGNLSVQVVAEALLLCSRASYYRTIRGMHLALRARLDTWAREGLGRIAARLRG
jgi:hypothetical protein